MRTCPGVGRRDRLAGEAVIGPTRRAVPDATKEFSCPRQSSSLRCVPPSAEP
ncbi:hypothetical protein Rrhod_3055 [Rhodococcus rhodnii LMG 5362]|uniref:Uncharacterized protein n=1 Tax=Rhodococcus rhodnii LMG 5362 TaxID=1273125 RepID=R7WJY4_9NOCA|nr:hypothetical protein Rrhod_3055 [Rhodococcus rhodnii LMG 5362]